MNKVPVFRSSVDLGNMYKSGLRAIRIRVSCGGRRVELYTGLSASNKQWDKKKERVKAGCYVNGLQYSVINSVIEEQLSFVSGYFNKTYIRGANPSLSELKIQFKHTFRMSANHGAGEFFALFGDYVSKRSETKRWSIEYKQMFERVGKGIGRFCPDVSFNSFDEAFMNRYIQFLSKSMYNDKIDKNISMLTEFLKYANSKNYPVNKEFFEYRPKLPQSKKAVRFLTEQDLKTIYNLDVEEGSALDTTRDLFVFQCYTALRYSDLKQLKHSNIRLVADGKYEIDILTEKDDDKVTFPLSKIATAIYLKYKDNLYENDVVFPVITNQKYNEHLKELGKAANLKGEWVDYQYRLDKVEVVRVPKSDLASHTARRTFVVLALSAGVPLDLVAQITSHATIKAMKPYIAVSQAGKQKVIDALDRIVQ